MSDQAVTHLANTGAGIPDLGLFDDNQPAEQKPAHGVIEAKPLSNDLVSLCQSKQVVEQYLPHYGQVFVTNFYQFALVTRDDNGNPLIEEVYKLADNEKAFWEAAAHPRALADLHDAALRKYVLRVMGRNAKLAEPRDVVWILASYAREARGRIKASGAGMDSLQHVRKQLEAARGCILRVILSVGCLAKGKIGYAW